MTATPETQAFQAETKDLLDLMIHSLYTKREIFLRELISNASDALDKLRYEALTNTELMAGDDRMEIRIDANVDAHTLTISDTGIGMTRDEVTRNLGTIARSGTREIREKMKEAGVANETEDLIGQFGVGFYSAFMVADKVTVVTRRAGETTASQWESTADGYFTVTDAEKDTRGTSITLHLRPADDDLGIEDYTNTWRLKDIIQRHSDFIPYPIKMMERHEEVERDDEGNPVEGSEKKVTYEDKTLNSQKPLWKRTQSQVEQSDYDDFYKHLTHDYEAPLKTIVSKAEGITEYHALLFIPAHAPMDLFYHDADFGLRLYAKQVLIAEKTSDLLPTYLRFMRGVIDAGELPLNISRQQLQQDAHVKKIGKWLTKKVLDTLVAMEKNEPELYEKFWASFGRAFKEGAGSDFENQERLLPLFRFASSNDPEKLTTLDAYVERMKEGQNEIFYITGESRAVLERSPHLEALAEKGYEVLFMMDAVDELVLQFVHQYKDKRLKSAAKGALDLQGDENKEAVEKKKEELKPLIEYLEKNLGAEIKRAQISTHLTKSPACLTVDEYEQSPWMTKLLQRSQVDAPARKRILEINPDHPIVTGLLQKVKENADAPKLASYAKVLVGMAMLAEGAELNAPIAFTDAATALLTSAIAG